MTIGVILYIAAAVLLVAGIWKVFVKAGQPGWAAIIPIYNWFIVTKIAGKPAWWVVLLLIPFVNFVVIIIMSIEIAKRFGKGTGFGVGLALLSFIFWPMLGFGDARYQEATA